MSDIFVSTVEGMLTVKEINDLLGEFKALKQENEELRKKEPPVFIDCPYCGHKGHNEACGKIYQQLKSEIEDLKKEQLRVDKLYVNAVGDIDKLTALANDAYTVMMGVQTINKDTLGFEFKSIQIWLRNAKDLGIK